MAQAIRNIKAGQRFLVIDERCEGFYKGTIVEALESVDGISKDYWFRCKWVGGTEIYQNIKLNQKIEHLKDLKEK